jgi:hypothetical protein
MKISSLSVLIYKLWISCIAIATFAVASPIFAQSTEANHETVQGYILSIIEFINFVLLPFLFSIALLFFLVNIARYFILKGDNDGDREKAKTLALYGIGAFVILVSLWGVVNMFVSGLEIDDDKSRCPDYLGNWCEQGYDYYGPGSDDYYYH